MKKIITIIASIALFNGVLKAQDDSVYIYKSGAVAYKQAVNNIDSVIFYKANKDLTNTVTDVEGTIYKTVTLGTQTWMAENLRTSKYNDNTDIPNVKDAAAWTNLTTDAQCTYNNTNDSLSIYGRYYNWYAAKTGKLCPTGWHIPTDHEFNVLEFYLDNTVDTTKSVNDKTGTTIGNQLKQVGTKHWKAPNDGATNSSGFNAVPAGYRQYDSGSFNGATDVAWYMTISDPNSTNTWARRLFSTSSQITRTNYDKKYGFAVRCVKTK